VAELRISQLVSIKELDRVRDTLLWNTKIEEMLKTLTKGLMAIHLKAGAYVWIGMSDLTRKQLLDMQKVPQESILEAPKDDQGHHLRVQDQLLLIHDHIRKVQQNQMEALRVIEKDHAVLYANKVQVPTRNKKLMIKCQLINQIKPN